VSDLLLVALVFLQIGLVAFGGSTAILPELELRVVDQHGWLTRREFVDSFALGQLTPGPALLMVMFAGYRVAGVAGACTALVAIFLPSALLCTLAAARWEHLRRWPWLASLQRACAAVALGLLVAGAYTISRVAIVDLETAAIAAGAFVALWRFRLSPAFVIVCAGLLAGVVELARG
jgi:chromate transporter